MLRARVEVSSGPDHGKCVALAIGQPTRIGKHSACDVSLSDLGVENWHVMIAYSDQTWRIYNLSSSETVELNGKEIDDGPKLADGDSIELGITTLTFVVEQSKSDDLGAVSAQDDEHLYKSAKNLLEDNLELNDSTVAELIFEEAADCTMADSLRRGSMIQLPPTGRLLISGDIHDHRENLQKIISLAELDQSPENHVLIQEVIHGAIQASGRDESIDTLLRTAALKLRYPDQVHILQSNHELGQVNGDPVLRDGKSVSVQFDRTLDHQYGYDADEVREAMRRYVHSLPLAVRTCHGLICCHSLPSPEDMDTFDPEVLNRVALDTDLTNGGSAFQLVWGRNYDQTVCEKLKKVWGVKWFVVGHEKAPAGHRVIANSALVILSEHERGVAIPIDLSRGYSLDDLRDNLIELSSVSITPAG